MPPHDAIAHFLLSPLLGLATGMLLGTLGSGGSILALPAFAYAADLPVKTAVATSLAVVGAASLIGAVLAKRRCGVHGCPGQEVDGRVTATMIAGGLIGAFTGSRLAILAPPKMQLILFTAVMLIAAAGMFRRAANSNTLAVEPVRGAGGGAAARILMLPIGLGVGLLTGFVGVGGGFLIVPAMTLAAKTPVKRAAAMSLWIIAANSAAGLAGYAGHVPIAWGAAGAFLVFAVMGLTTGQRLAARVPANGLQIGFAVLLALVACFTVWKMESAPPTGRVVIRKEIRP